MGKRKSLIRLTLVVVLCFTATFIQAQTVTKIFRNEPLGTVLKVIEQQTGLSVIYNSNEVNENQKITASFNKSSLPEVFSKILGSGLEYRVQNKMIIIKKASLTKPSEKSDSHKNVTGTVIDENGEPLIGASVALKNNTGVGTVTDIEGHFTLKVPGNSVLLISYIGYDSKSVSVGEKNNLNIQLSNNSKQLNEVVVVGYGTQKKVNLTGSVSSVSTEQLQNRVETNVLSAIQGVVPGVTIISRPGGTPSINFRGRGNLGTSAPLYVIDGAISDATFFQNLDPNSIESISFLKDAASASIYGSRAAYGVVLVTTKQGQANKINVTYNGYVGFKTATYLPKSVNSVEYATLKNEGAYNFGLVTNKEVGKYSIYSENEIQKFGDGSDPDYYPDTDWLDLCLDKTVTTTSHDLNFSGGTDKVHYYAGLGFNYDDNFVPDRNDYRYNLTSNISADLNKWLTMRADIKYIRNENKNGAGLSLSNCISIPSIMVAKQSNGDFGTIAGGSQAPVTWITGNPLRGMSKNNWSQYNSENTMYNLAFDVKPLKGLVVTGQGSYKRYEYKGKSYVGLQDEIGFFETGNAISGTGNSTNYMNMSWSSNSDLLAQLIGKYNTTIGKHTFGVMAGTSFERYLYEAISAYRKNFTSDSSTDISAGATADATNGGGSSEYKILSYFGRLNYSFDDKYLFEFNIRADGSSRFYKDSRWGYFPSVSAAWRVSQEDFMKNIDWVQNLKIRASYGTLGNINNVGNYDYFQNYKNGTDYVFDGNVVSSVTESRPANKKLTWERVSIADVGLDFSLFNSRLDVTADYYDKRTSKILLVYNVPLEKGISSKPSQNIAKVSNKGFELSATWRDNIGDWHYRDRKSVV